MFDEKQDSRRHVTTSSYREEEDGPDQYRSRWWRGTFLSDDGGRHVVVNVVVHKWWR